MKLMTIETIWVVKFCQVLFSDVSEVSVTNSYLIHFSCK